MADDIFTMLSARQIRILIAIIEEYIATAEPVGSETLEKKFNLGVSPATIRNDMLRLTRIGLLAQPHTSSGRTPTPIALKYYVENLMKPKDLSVAEEVAVKEKIWDYRQQMEKLLREATRTLAERTRTLAITATNDGDIYYSGASNILEMPEFYDFELTHNVLSTLDSFDYWWNLWESREDVFDILLGNDLSGPVSLTRCAVIYTKFKTPHATGAIGIVGPSRLNYSQVIPTVKYIGSLINEFAGNL